MNSTKIRQAIQTALWKVREDEIPRRKGVKLKYPNRQVTGNMKFNATKVEYLGKTSRIFVDENIAPYVPYTNEPWVSPRWNGTQNPNENWFDDFTLAFAQQLARELGGTLIIK